MSKIPLVKDYRMRIRVLLMLKITASRSGLSRAWHNQTILYRMTLARLGAGH